MTKRANGYVALLSVLIVGAAATAVALGLLIGGADSQKSVLIVQQSTQARSLATACGEEALQQIHDNTSFTTTGTNLSLGQGSCSYVVTNTGGSNRQIAATGTVGNVVRKVNIHVTIGVSSISITSWQDVT